MKKLTGKPHLKYYFRHSMQLISFLSQSKEKKFDVHQEIIFLRWVMQKKEIERAKPNVVLMQILLNDREIALDEITFFYELFFL